MIVALLAMRTGELHAQRKAVREPGLSARGSGTSGAPRLCVPARRDAPRLPLHVQLQRGDPVARYRTYGGSAIEIGWLYAALGLGAFLGAIAMANRQTRPTLGRLAAFSVAFGVFIAGAGLAPTFLMAMVAMVPVGYASMLFAITANSTLQQFTRSDMRGRVMALYTTIFLGSTAIGGPITGWVAETWGAPATFVASGAVAVAAGLIALRAGACIGFGRGSGYGRYCSSIRVISPPSTVIHHGTSVPA